MDWKWTVAYDPCTLRSSGICICVDDSYFGLFISPLLQFYFVLLDLLTSEFQIYHYIFQKANC